MAVASVLMLAVLAVFTSAGQAEAATGAPIGYVDSVSYVTQPNGLVQVTVSGWVLDSHNPASAASVYFWWQDPNSQVGSYTFPTAWNRPDVNAAYKTTGKHGFTEQFLIQPHWNYYVKIRGEALGVRTLLTNGSFSTGKR